MKPAALQYVGRAKLAGPSFTMEAWLLPGRTPPRTAFSPARAGGACCSSMPSNRNGSRDWTNLTADSLNSSFSTPTASSRATEQAHSASSASATPYRKSRPSLPRKLSVCRWRRLFDRISRILVPQGDSHITATEIPASHGCGRLGLSRTRQHRVAGPERNSNRRTTPRHRRATKRGGGHTESSY